MSLEISLDEIRGAAPQDGCPEKNRVTLTERNLAARAPLDGDIKIHTVLLKFYVNKEDYIPEGIVGKGLVDQDKREEEHAEKAERAGHAELAEKGRYRANRIDTGKNVIDELEFCQVAAIRRGLANNGYHLAAVPHYYQKQRKGSNGKSQWIMVLDHKKESIPTEEKPSQPLTEAVKIDEKAMDGIRVLANLTWKVSLFINPDGSMTINCHSRSEVPPRCALRIKNREFYVDEIIEFLSETEENFDSLQKALA